MESTKKIYTHQGKKSLVNTDQGNKNLIKNENKLISQGVGNEWNKCNPSDHKFSGMNKCIGVQKSQLAPTINYPTKLYGKALLSSKGYCDFLTYCMTHNSIKLNGKNMSLLDYCLLKSKQIQEKSLSEAEAEAEAEAEKKYQQIMQQCKAEYSKRKEQYITESLRHAYSSEPQDDDIKHQDNLSPDSKNITQPQTNGKKSYKNLIPPRPGIGWADKDLGIVYMTKKELEDYCRVHIVDGKITFGSEKQKLDPNAVYNYVHMPPGPEDKDQKTKLFIYKLTPISIVYDRHSSMTNLMPCIAAGELKTDNEGNPCEFNNKSGHHPATTETTQTSLSILETEEGLNVDNVLIHDITADELLPDTSSLLQMFLTAIGVKCGKVVKTTKTYQALTDSNSKNSSNKPKEPTVTVNQEKAKKIFYQLVQKRKQHFQEAVNNSINKQGISQFLTAFSAHFKEQSGIDLQDADTSDNNVDPENQYFTDGNSDESTSKKDEKVEEEEKKEQKKQLADSVLLALLNEV